MSERVQVLVRGVGDVGSAVAVALFRARYAVALHDEPDPATSRRGMAFADALFDGFTSLDGLVAQRARTIDEFRSLLTAGAMIPISACPFQDVQRTFPWSVIIDARMRKREIPEDQRGSAPLTIGLGPNFIAGGNVDLAVETSWGDRLGAIIEQGATLPLDGEPQSLGGIARARFVYAPVAGRFETQMHIGASVEQGAVMASITGIELCAPVRGVIRGLTRNGVAVAQRAKVIEIDPRGDPSAAFGVAARPRCIAEGVLQAVARVRDSGR